MLLQLNENTPFSSFSDLYTISLSLLQNVGDIRKTMVIGPVTSKRREDFERNLEEISHHSESLSEEGWAVFDMNSFQPAIDALIKQNGIKGYPHEVLEDFTLPLLESGQFTAIHVLKNYQESFGATLEHDKALGVGVPVTYIP